MNLNDTVPYDVGLIVQIVGSTAQQIMIRAMREAKVDGLVTQRVLRDGDLVQLLCTALAVLPSAFLAIEGRPVLFPVTVVVTVAVLGLCLLGIPHWNAGRYEGRSWFIFSPACDVALAFCILGFIFAAF